MLTVGGKDSTNMNLSFFLGGMSMKVKAYKINAFAQSAAGGNPAGVVTNAGYLSEKDMKKIASILGLSETAFVLKSDCADFKLRYFTPTEEVDLCGHATIGAFAILLNEGSIKPGRYTQETKAGVLNVEVKSDLTIMMDQALPIFYDVIGKAEIADSLNIPIHAIDNELPVQIVSTGLRDIIIPVKDTDILNSISPDFNKVAKISNKYNAVGYHIFAHNPYEFIAYCRNLAPLYGIPEESATGTSNGALACYLFKYNRFNVENAGNIVFKQGYSMNMPSEILVSLKVEKGEVLEVKVGGKTINISAIEVEL